MEDGQDRRERTGVQEIQHKEKGKVTKVKQRVRDDLSAGMDN